MNNESVENKIISENKQTIEAKRSQSAAEVDGEVVGEDRNSQDAKASNWSSTYESFFWLFNYIIMFITRLAKDLFYSLLSKIYSEQVLPNHIIDLMGVQKNLYLELQIYNNCNRENRPYKQLPKKGFFREYILNMFSSEDDFKLQRPSRIVYSGTSRQDDKPGVVIVDSNCIIKPNSNELVDNIKAINEEPISGRKSHKIITDTDLPSTSKDFYDEKLSPKTSAAMTDTKSQESMEENEDRPNLPFLIYSYLRNHESKLDIEKLLATRKKHSLLRGVSKMESIPEDELFSSFPLSLLKLSTGNGELSDSSLDVHIPSFPASPRSISRISIATEQCKTNTYFPMKTDSNELRRAVDFLHEDNLLLIAAETGHDQNLEDIIRKGANVQQMDQLGRNALHLAVCSGNVRAITLLLEAGINPNVKDNVGMTPLSLSLMRRPSLEITHLLFDHGATIMPRTNPVDTGLFLQFIMVCTPTKEEIRILRLLLEKGGDLNDPQAPGGRQALHFAAMSNNCQLIKVLIDLGADVAAENHRYQTPKEVALSFQCREAYNLLEDLELCLSISTISSRTTINTNSKIKLP